MKIVNILNDQPILQLEEDWLQQMRSGEYDAGTWHLDEDPGSPRLDCESRVGQYEARYLDRCTKAGELDPDDVEQIKLKLKEWAWLDEKDREAFRAEIDAMAETF